MTTDDDEEEARDRLLFHLENQTGFWFALVVGDDAQPRARMREAAEAWCKEHGKAFALHEPTPEGLVKLAVELAKGESPGVHWIRADGVRALVESWNARATQMFLAMNERREAYRERLDGGIIVEGRPVLKRILREMAPDLFTIRAFVAELGNEPKQHSDTPPEWNLPLSPVAAANYGLDPEEALQRLARFIAFGGKPGTEQWIAAAHAAAASLFSEGRYDEAKQHAQSILSKLEQESHGSTTSEQVAAARYTAHAILGASAFTKEDYNESITQLDRSIQSLQSYPAHDPENERARALHINTLHRLRAVTFLMSENSSAGEDALRQSIETLLRMKPHQIPPETKLELVESYLTLAESLRRRGQLEAAEKILRTAVRYVEDRVAENPNEERWQLELLKTRTSLGTVLAQNGKLPAAIGRLSSAISVCTELEGHEPSTSDFAEHVEKAYISLSSALALAADFNPASLPIHERALKYMNIRLRQSSENSSVAWGILAIRIHRAKLLRSLGDLAEADLELQQGADVVSRLTANNPLEARLKAELTLLTSQQGATWLRRPGPSGSR